MIRFGAFLKQLRKEKGLTQEQLAEQLHTSGRTVSRWENGNNLPDLDTLLLLADLYEVDVRELIEGTRFAVQEEPPNPNTVENLVEYASYTEQQLLRKILTVVFCGMAAWGISLLPVFHSVQDFVGGGIVLVLSLGCMVLYGLGVFAIKTNRTAAGCLHALTGAFVTSSISNLCVFFLYFGSGSYWRSGFFGIVTSAAVFITSFICTGMVVTAINKKAVRQATPTKTPGEKPNALRTCTFWFGLAGAAVVLLNALGLDDMNLIMIGANPLLNLLSSSPWCTAIARTPYLWHILSLFTMLLYGLLLDFFRYIKKKLTAK